MSSSFSANQYEGTFKSSRLQNWCLPKEFKERPTARGGHTTFIANDQGHLLPRIKRGSAWPDYKGTWDLPDRIPGHHVYPTSRSAIGVNRQKTWDFDPQDAGKSRQQGGITSPDELADDGDENVQQDCAPTSSADKARPASQYLLVNEGEPPANQNQSPVPYSTLRQARLNPMLKQIHKA
uniref:Protein Flattop n=1 Tax=Mola mola TaxID=94237 RepID=A0A3Q3XJK9_MOLML